MKLFCPIIIGTSVYSNLIKFNIHYGTEMCSKSIATETVFTWVEMNDELNYFCPIIVDTFVYTVFILNATFIMGQRWYNVSCVKNIWTVAVFTQKLWNKSCLPMTKICIYPTSSP